jgi:hypothetical protein
MTTGNAPLDRAIDSISPLCNDLGGKLVGHNALSIAVLAAYCLRAYEQALSKEPPTGHSRHLSLNAIGIIADTLETVCLPVSKDN